MPCHSRPGLANCRARPLAIDAHATCDSTAHARAIIACGNISVEKCRKHRSSLDDDLEALLFELLPRRIGRLRIDVGPHLHAIKMVAHGRQSQTPETSSAAEPAPGPGRPLAAPPPPPAAPSRPAESAALQSTWTSAPPPLTRLHLPRHSLRRNFSRPRCRRRFCSRTCRHETRTLCSASRALAAPLPPPWPSQRRLVFARLAAWLCWSGSPAVSRARRLRWRRASGGAGGASAGSAARPQPLHRLRRFPRMIKIPIRRRRPGSLRRRTRLAGAARRILLHRSPPTAFAGTALGGSAESAYRTGCVPADSPA